MVRYRAARAAKELKKVRPTTLMGGLSASLQVDEEEAASEPD